MARSTVGGSPRAPSSCLACGPASTPAGRPTSIAPTSSVRATEATTNASRSNPRCASLRSPPEPGPVAVPVVPAAPPGAVPASRRVRIAGLLGASFGDLAQPLADEQFRWLWLSTFAWNFARWMEMTVTGWVALELTGSPWLVALIGVTRSAFLPVAGPITGALSDRFDRVRLMKTAQWGNVLAIGAIALALLAGHGAYWQLVLVSLWLGVSWGIDWPSRRALLADLVGPERVLQAVVLDNVTQN